MLGRFVPGRMGTKGPGDRSVGVRCHDDGLVRPAYIEVTVEPGSFPRPETGDLPLDVGKGVAAAGQYVIRDRAVHRSGR